MSDEIEQFITALLVLGPSPLHVPHTLRWNIVWMDYRRTCRAFAVDTLGHTGDRANSWVHRFISWQLRHREKGNEQQIEAER